jgi:hypothetical protein
MNFPFISLSNEASILAVEDVLLTWIADAEIVLEPAPMLVC